jgi:hypothetical protein
MERRLTEEAEIDVDSKKVRQPEGGVDKLGGEMRGGGVRRVDGKGAERKRERGRHPAFLNRMKGRERERESVASQRQENEGGGVGTPHGGGRRKERGAWRGGGRFGAASNGPRPSGTGGAMPRKQRSPGADRWAMTTVLGCYAGS